MYFYLAVLRCGGVFAAELCLHRHEIEYFLTDAEPKLHVCSRDRARHAYNLKHSLTGLVLTLDDKSGSLFDLFAASSEGKTVEAIVPRGSMISLITAHRERLASLKVQ